MIQGLFHYAVSRASAALSGTTNSLARWTSTTTLGSSLIQDDGSNISTSSSTVNISYDATTGLYLGPANVPSITLGNNNSNTTVVGDVDFTGVVTGLLDNEILGEILLEMKKTRIALETMIGEEIQITEDADEDDEVE